MPADGAARLFAVLGAFFAFLAVAAGAFGAHALQTRVPAERIEIFETAARYQMYHALALVVVAWVTTQWDSHAITAAGWLFVAGMIIFSGSLYALSLSGASWLGAVTPLGGLCLLAGWLSLAWGIFTSGQ